MYATATDRGASVTDVEGRLDRLESTVASHAFGSRDVAPDLGEETHHEVLPAAVATREYSRMGLVTRLLRHYTDGIDHLLVDVFDTRATVTVRSTWRQRWRLTAAQSRAQRTSTRR